MQPQNYGLDLSKYKESDNELLSKGSKYRNIGIVLIIVSIPIFLYGGFISFFVGLYLLSLDKKFKKVVSQRAFEANRQSYIDEIFAKYSEPPHFDVEIEENAKLKRRALSSMKMIDFTSIRKSTPLSKIFPLVVVDVETTGLSAKTDRIIELSAYRYDNNFEPTSRFTALVNPEIPISPEASATNGITDDMVSEAPTLAQMAKSFEAFISGCNIAGYNLRFDLNFLYTSGIALSDDVLYFDVYELAKNKIKKRDVTDYKLQTICDYLGIPMVFAHRGFADCYITGEVFEKLVMQDRS